jgi:hypothetical protein
VGAVHNIREELIFSYERTGLLIAHDAEVASKSEKKEVYDAIEEYFLLKENFPDPFFVFTYLNSPQYEAYKIIKEIIKEISIVCNLSIDYTVKSIKIEDQFDGKIYILSSLRSALQSIEFISYNINDIYSDECLIIARSIIEHYIRTKSVRLGKLDPKVVLYQALASRGVLEYAVRPNGKIDYNKIIAEDGKIVDISYTYGALAKATNDPIDTFIYEHIYKTLSYFVHRDASDRIISALKEQNLRMVLHDVEDDEISGTYICAKIIFYYLLEFLQNDWLDKKTVKDLTRKIIQLATRLDALETNPKIAELSF